MDPGPRDTKRNKKQAQEAQEDGSGHDAASPARRKPGRPRKDKGKADVQPGALPADSTAASHCNAPLVDSGGSVASGDKLDFKALLARQGRPGRPRKTSPAVEPSRLYRLVR